MKESESKVLEAAALLYNAIPGYLAATETKQQMGRLLVDLIDALDDIEYTRSGTPLYDIIGGNAPGRRKKAILAIEQEFGLTEREGHILRYLANERNPTYIANALGISPSTAKAHKYSIFKKLGVHTSEELRLCWSTTRPIPRLSPTQGRSSLPPFLTCGWHAKKARRLGKAYRCGVIWRGWPLWRDMARLTAVVCFWQG